MLSCKAIKLLPEGLIEIESGKMKTETMERHATISYQHLNLLDLAKWWYTVAAALWCLAMNLPTVVGQSDLIEFLYYQVIVHQISPVT